MCCIAEDDLEFPILLPLPPKPALLISTAAAHVQFMWHWKANPGFPESSQGFMELYPKPR